MEGIALNCIGFAVLVVVLLCLGRLVELAISRYSKPAAHPPTQPVDHAVTGQTADIQHPVQSVDQIEEKTVEQDTDTHPSVQPTDQVAEKTAELQRLREQNERLRTEVDGLRKTIIERYHEMGDINELIYLIEGPLPGVSNHRIHPAASHTPTDPVTPAPVDSSDVTRDSMTEPEQLYACPTPPVPTPAKPEEGSCLNNDIKEGQLIPFEMVSLREYLTNPPGSEESHDSYWETRKKWIEEEMRRRNWLWIVVCGGHVATGSPDMADIPDDKKLLEIGKEYDRIPFLFVAEMLSE
ncbi:MAG: hypothetical protein WC797_03370 [Candidatus Paceibacterota bacterium]|jgi:hypothetical protein